MFPLDQHPKPSTIRCVRYDCVARETARKISRESVKKEFHAEERLKAVGQVEDRLRNYLAITQVMDNWHLDLANSMSAMLP